MAPMDAAIAILRKKNASTTPNILGSGWWMGASPFAALPDLATSDRRVDALQEIAYYHRIPDIKHSKTNLLLGGIYY
jgi:hypothetical protein